MTTWQKDYITRNKLKLIQVTVASQMVLDSLIGKGHLARIEVQRLKCIVDREGDFKQASELYDILVQRAGSFKDLIEVLKTEKQTDAVNILEKGQQIYELISTIAKDPKLLLQLQHDGLVSAKELTPEKIHMRFSERVVAGKTTYDDVITTLEDILKAQNTHESIQNNGKQLELYNEAIEVATSPNCLPIASDDSDDKTVFFREYQQASKTKLTVKVEKPTDCMRNKFVDHYVLPDNNKGWALIINIVSFDKEWRNGMEIDLTRYGAENDGKYMHQLWEQLGYKIFCKDEITKMGGYWKKEDVESMLETFRVLCNECQPNSIVVYIGSHGEHNKIIASDLKKLSLYQDILQKFYHIGTTSACVKTASPHKDIACKGLNGKPKIFLVNACQTFELEYMDGTLVIPASDILVWVSQVPGFVSWRNATGSWFTHCLTYVFMKYACKKSLSEMVELVNGFLKNVGDTDPKTQQAGGGLIPLPHGQVPVAINIGLQRMYFFSKPTH